MQFSYDYSELIEELGEELADGILDPSDVIQILRAEEPVYQDYRPIIDWYYSGAAMHQMLVDIDQPEREQYFLVKPALENISVKECLYEMEYQGRIVK